jgi:hypothetical protein
MKAGKLKSLIPLAFMAIGLIILLWGEREFQRRADRDNAELRQDLNEAGVSRAELAAIMSAETKLQANASSYTQSMVFMVFIVSMLSIIPLYARMASEKAPDGPAG